jgi:hypothetical protein
MRFSLLSYRPLNQKGKVKGLRPLEAMEFGSGNAECGKENLEWGRRMRDEGGRGKIEGGRLRGWEGEKVRR